MFEALRHDCADISSAAWRNVSASALDLLHRMLLKDPAKRISAENVLRHAWMQRLAPPTVVAPRGDCGVAPWSVVPSRSAPTESSRVDSKAEAGGRLLPSTRRADCDSACGAGNKPPERGGSMPGQKPGYQGTNRVGDNCASARVFYTPQGLRQRLLLHGFVDTFKSQVRLRGTP